MRKKGCCRVYRHADGKNRYVGSNGKEYLSASAMAFGEDLRKIKAWEKADKKTNDMWDTVEFCLGLVFFVLGIGVHWMFFIPAFLAFDSCKQYKKKARYGLFHHIEKRERNK